MSWAAKHCLIFWFMWLKCIVRSTSYLLRFILTQHSFRIIFLRSFPTSCEFLFADYNAFALIVHLWLCEPCVFEPNWFWVVLTNRKLTYSSHWNLIRNNSKWRTSTIHISQAIKFHWIRQHDQYWLCVICCIVNLFMSRFRHSAPFQSQSIPFQALVFPCALTSY